MTILYPFQFFPTPDGRHIGCATVCKIDGDRWPMYVRWQPESQQPIDYHLSQLNANVAIYRCDNQPDLVILNDTTNNNELWNKVEQLMINSLSPLIRNLITLLIACGESPDAIQQFIAQQSPETPLLALACRSYARRCGPPSIGRNG